MAGDFGSEFMGVEYFTLAAGERGPGDGPNGWESDLFAGIARGEPAPPEAVDDRVSSPHRSLRAAGASGAAGAEASAATAAPSTCC